MMEDDDDDVAFGSRDANVGNRDVIVYRLPNRSLNDNCQLLDSLNPQSLSLLQQCSQLPDLPFQSQQA